LGITAIVSFTAIAFLIIAMNTGDLLWFWPRFDELPVSMVVHCYGQDVFINAGDSAFQPVYEVVNDSLSGTKRYDPLSMSDITYEEYQTHPSMMVIELSYDPPTRIHSMVKFFKNVDTLIIPLDGRHANTQAVFGRIRDNTTMGSMHPKSTAPIMEVIEEQGLCYYIP
jgi:hypothetical protein